MPHKRQQDQSNDPLAKLTWDDLDDWAGDTIVARGRSYHRSSTVSGLARSVDGGLVATVRGTRMYHTSVLMVEGRLSSECTCPYNWGPCKHAVAVVLEYLDCVKQGKPVPVVSVPVEVTPGALEDDSLDGSSNEVRGVDDSYSEAQTEALQAYVTRLTKKQLVELTLQLAASQSAVRTVLLDRIALGSGDAGRMTARIRADLDELLSDSSWVDSWHGRWHTPDYSPVRERMEQLLAAGHADALLSLGQDLLEQGASQVEQSHDEGELADEIVECLKVVFRALPMSSWSPSEQILWAIDAHLGDEYGLCQVPDAVWDEGRTAGDWSAVADVLTARLRGLGRPSDDFSERYRRDRQSDWLITALERAGRAEEIIPLCEQEAPLTASYVRLIDRLLTAERYDEAEQWASVGLGALGEGPWGVRSDLQKRLHTIAEKTGDKERVAALRAHAFFEAPSLSQYDALLTAAREVGIRDTVRRGALRFLETALRPDRGKPKTKSWPLPPVDLPTSDRHHKGPHYALLVDIAIAENRPNEALQWYDRLEKEKPFGLSAVAERLASAVTDSHPDRAVQLYKVLAEGQINVTKASAYPVAARYLRRARDILVKAERAGEWERYRATLRETHKRKRRFVEILDRLDGKRVVEG